MRELIFIILISLSAGAESSCPDTDKKETQNDCPWAEITRQITEQKKNCEKAFKAQIPYIFNQLKTDKKSKEFISLWGEARNFDDNAKEIIIASPIVKCLAQKLDLTKSIHQQKDFETLHAGMQHTYAYLFSNTWTPYGYKRARWTSQEVQKGFNLNEKELTPENSKGSFLANVTYFFSKFAFKDDKELLTHLEKEGRKTKSLSENLIKFKTDQHEIRNLKETILNPSIILHTTFVKMDSDSLIGKNTYLLIYWVENLKNKSKLLITGFPVESSFVDRVFESKNLGSDKPITVRYNAWVPELAGLTLIGTREEIK